MDEILENSSTESNTKSCSYFTGCFGSFNQKKSKDMKAASSSNNKKTTAWTSLSSFRTNKSTVKTIPVEAAVSEKLNQSGDFSHSPKSDKKISQQQNKQAAGITNAYSPATNSKTHKKNLEIDKDIIREDSNIDQSIPVVKDDKLQNRRKENKRTRSSSSGSLQVESNNIVSTKTKRVLPHSISLPVPNRKKETAVRGGDDIDGGRETQGKFDPIVGMSVIMMTLAIMIIWGKLCAILCMSAWLFIVPRLRTVMDSKDNIGNGLNSGGLDLESEEYKKKVVLEGLLQRNHRRVIGNL